jgi:hypothetical protein
MLVRSFVRSLGIDSNRFDTRTDLRIHVAATYVAGATATVVVEGIAPVAVVVVKGGSMFRLSGGRQMRK